MHHDTVIEEDAQALAERMGEWLITRLGERREGDIRLLLCGGATPLPLYRRLAEPEQVRRLDCGRLHLFWGDERLVPYSHPDSNYGAVHQILVRHLPLPPGHVHPIPVSGTPQQAASRYAATLQSHYGAATLASDRPLFDLVLLGIGADGHTASLFPGMAALAETRRWALAVHPAGQAARITLTLPVLASAAAVAFIATGAHKRPAVQRVLAGDTGLPAARVTPSGSLHYFLDRQAAP